jgi:hypothetical protein
VSGSGGEGRYVRAVEAAWSKLRERPVVLSPRDFELVDGWRRRGIPLSVVLEVLEDRAKRRGAGGGRSLAHLVPAIEEAWMAVSAGRAVRAIAPSGRTDTGPRAVWGATLARLPDDSQLKTLLEQLVAEAETGVGADVLDARLDEALPALVPAELRVRVEHESALALASFRTRMRREEFARTSARALADRLRTALSLPRLPSGG